MLISQAQANVRFFYVQDPRAPLRGNCMEEVPLRFDRMGEHLRVADRDNTAQSLDVRGAPPDDMRQLFHSRGRQLSQARTGYLRSDEPSPPMVWRV